MAGFVPQPDLRTAVQNQIEDRNRADILQDITTLFASPTVSSPLLSDLDSINTFGPTSVISNGTIWHNSSTENIGFQGDKVDGSLQISLGEVGTTAVGLHVAFPQVSTPEISTVTTSSDELTLSQVSSIKQGSVQTRIPQTNITQGSFTEVSSYKLASSEIGSSQVNSQQIGTSQIGSFQTDITQIGSFQVCSNQLDRIEISTRQIDTSQISIDKVSIPDGNSFKIPLPSSISLQQLFSSHNSNLQNTTVPTWLKSLQGTTPFNLNIEITDLPTGQLAEAAITAFDPTGRPNAGTLYLDVDANGLGWYIDPTPWDNTEYSQTITDTAYRATADSLAYNHSKTVRIWIWLKPMFSFSVQHIFVATGFGIAFP